MAKVTPNGATRQEILHAALKRFAHGGYAATSVQQIVDDAKVSKPALYYYFKDKAGLFQALVHEAHDERYRLLREAAERQQGIRAKLEEILRVLFDYFDENRELMRISFATTFAAPGEIPEDLCLGDKCERNFEFVHSLIKRAQAAGELDKRYRCPRTGVWLLRAGEFLSRVAPGDARFQTRTGRRPDASWICFSWARWPARQSDRENFDCMKKKIVLSVVVVLVVAGVLAGVKTLQIRTLMAAAATIGAAARIRRLGHGPRRKMAEYPSGGRFHCGGARRDPHGGTSRHGARDRL